MKLEEYNKLLRDCLFDTLLACGVDPNHPDINPIVWRGHFVISRLGRIWNRNPRVTKEEAMRRALEYMEEMTENYDLKKVEKLLKKVQPKEENDGKNDDLSRKGRGVPDASTPGDRTRTDETSAE